MSSSSLAPADQSLVARYRAGVTRVESALGRVSESDLDRADAGGWTARMVVHHLADSETRSYLRARQLLVDDEPVRIEGYDEERWAECVPFGYRTEPIEPSLDVFRAVRHSCSLLLDRLSPSNLDREGVHSQTGRYTLRDWLRIYAEHAEDHANQIEAAASSRGHS